MSLEPAGRDPWIGVHPSGVEPPGLQVHDDLPGAAACGFECPMCGYRCAAVVAMGFPQMELRCRQCHWPYAVEIPAC